MKRQLITLIGAIALMVGLLGAWSPVANAAEQSKSTFASSSDGVKATFKTTPRSVDGENEQEYSSCENIDVNSGKGDCADTVSAESSSGSSTKAKVVSVNGVSIHSKITVLARIRAHGTPKSQQTNCRRIDHAMTLWTSYDASGTTGWHRKSYPKGYRFCEINGKIRDPECDNQVKIGVPKSHPPKNAITGKVKFVKRIVYRAVSVSRVHEKVVARSKSWCNTANTHAYGEGRGSAEVWAKGRAVLKGRVLVKLFASVNAASQGNLEANLEAQGIVDVKGQTKSSAFGKAVAESSSKAVCSETEQYDECSNIPGNQPEGYECYPPSQPPTIVDLTRPNDTNPGWTTPACAVADFPKEHSGTLYFAFESGTVQGTNPVQVNDLQQGCVTLVSPTEEGWYTYKVTATDSVTGLSVTKESQPYHVYATPPLA